MVSATGYCLKLKREPGRHLLEPVVISRQTSRAFIPCLKWNCCSTFWLTVWIIVLEDRVETWGFTNHSFACGTAALCAVSGESTEVWIGLWKRASSPAVEWSDGTPVTLSLWHQYHPPHNQTEATLCAKADRKVGNHVGCWSQLRSFCEKFEID